jgi:hypothetical protein
MAIYRTEQFTYLLGISDTRVVSLTGRGQGTFQVGGRIRLCPARGHGISEYLAAALMNAMCGLQCPSVLDAA